MKDFKVTKTGHAYDFAEAVENLTDYPLYFVVDENNSDIEWDEDGNYLYGNIVYRLSDKEEAENYSGSFVIPPHDWVGLADNEIVQ